MLISFVEIQNFRRLKSIRIDFSDETTLFVGANNSGKTSAMEALSHFLLDQRFSTKEFTLSNWQHINKIGVEWEKNAGKEGVSKPDISEWESVLPSLDVWLHIEANEIRYVNHLLPSLDWKGGLLGVRLRFEPKDLEELYKAYLLAIQSVRDVRSKTTANGGEEKKIVLWPSTMHDFLDKRMNGLFAIRAYSLDPTKCTSPKNGIARPQNLPKGSDPLEGDPFEGLIRINEIKAQRGFTDVGNKDSEADNEEDRGRPERLKLSAQLRKYYDKHLNPSDSPEASDVQAIVAIEDAQKLFDERLEECFKNALSEVESMGYPGMTDPKITISTRLTPMDGLNHSSAVLFEILDGNGTDSIPLRLPEQYNGLGYQNLISMVFRLLSFRDAWMLVGKAEKKAIEDKVDRFLPPLHLVMLEEPEVHLHAQVQQVFIRKAYEILRKHDSLGNKTKLRTQLIVSTHSSHIAHECEYSWLRYFQRRLPGVSGEVPFSAVVNLSEVFGPETETKRFVTRYLRATHCDLFFADAAILVEGTAERVLVPHFLHEHFPKLRQRYITLLEINGSHAHKLKPLIEALGLTTVIITDIDTMDSGKHRVQPVRNQNLVTRNATLKTWLPGEETIDKLLDMPEAQRVKDNVCVCYQQPVSVQIGDKSEEALMNTFEDSLVFENLDIFKKLEGTGMIKKFQDAINKHKTVVDLSKEIFGILKEGGKAEFALDLLDLKDLEPKSIKTPNYISNGLSWLQKQLTKKEPEKIALAKESGSKPKQEVAK